MADMGNEINVPDHPPSSSHSTSTSQRLAITTPSADLAQITTTSTNKFNHGWRRIVRNFSPSWFSVTMGTGIVSILIISIPYPAPWLYYLSLPFFLLNLILFTLFLAISIVRYTLYPEIWGVMIRDPKNSLFLGTIPMGLATLIEMIIFALVDRAGWGVWAVYLAWGLWMLDTAVAVLTTLFLCFLLCTSSETRSLEQITAVQLLPIAATIVAAGTGAEIAAFLPHEGVAFGTVVTCYVLWGMGFPLAMTVLVIYYQRLALHKLPPREALVSCFLPLGPLGFGGYTIMYLGKVAREVFPAVGALAPVSELAGDVLYILGFITALIMWGFGLVWMVLAVGSCVLSSRSLPFNLGWFGFVFPLGVYAASTIQIGIELDSGVFKVLGTVFSVVVVLLWAVVAVRTIKGAWSGHLFVAPCLTNLKAEYVERGRVARPGKGA